MYTVLSLGRMPCRNVVLILNCHRSQLSVAVRCKMLWKDSRHIWLGWHQEAALRLVMGEGLIQSET